MMSDESQSTDDALDAFTVRVRSALGPGTTAVDVPTDALWVRVAADRGRHAQRRRVVWGSALLAVAAAAVFMVVRVSVPDAAVTARLGEAPALAALDSALAQVEAERRTTPSARADDEALFLSTLRTELTVAFPPGGD